MTHVVHSGKIFSHAANARVICLLDRSADSSTVQATHTTATDRLAIGATASISASSPPGLSDGLIGGADEPAAPPRFLCENVRGRGAMSKRERRIKVKAAELARIAAADKERLIQKARKLEKRKAAEEAKGADAQMVDVKKVKRRKIKVRKHHIKIKALVQNKKAMKQ